MLSVTQRLGIITLIPKGDKDKSFLKNWRPLTLLNSIYKLVSGCIADRIKPHLDILIHGDQKGFVSGRYIGEAIRTTYDILNWAKHNNKTGILLLIDFEKAYDSLSFTFIRKCLHFFNFGQVMINWIELLLHNFSAVINHCGNISEKFIIARGARQGDPIASYIFIICIEILAYKLRSNDNVKGFQMNNLTHLLELYADDCSIYLEAKEENLRNALKILSSFYEISGLKISLSKTKAIWFGNGCANTEQLCSDLQLDWDTKFKLLGIEFSNNLEGMESNFYGKIEEIKKIFNCWINRTLTVYGKIVIIKSLALSKLSHLALVLPDLNATQIKKIESLLFNFLWDNKPDKVCREHSKLAEKAGGLGVPDIKSFWQALKFSWFRRALSTSAFWPSIFTEEIKGLVGYDVKISDILQFGPNKLKCLGGKIKNNFWKQTLSSVTPFMQGALFCYPEKIVIAPIWDNPIVTRNNKPLKMSDFPGVSHKLYTMSDFYEPGTFHPYSRAEIETKYEININDATLLELHYIFKIARIKLGLGDIHSLPTFLPSQPLLINILNLNQKGCNVFYRLLRKQLNLKTTLSIRENRWHTELQQTFGVDFWNKTYNLAANIKNENKMKFLQFQINRNSLYTNYKVNKFKNHISPYCSFCSPDPDLAQDGHRLPHPELVSHLFFDCDIVHNLWIEVQSWLRMFNINLPFDRKSILFGLVNEESNSVLNYIILSVKYFIWKTKFQSQELFFQPFKHFLKNKLTDLKNSLIYIEMEDKFEPWLNVFNNLSTLE